jgi:tetratricopeptide (TPR) repeat protein
MAASAQALLQSAVQLHRQGKLTEAEQLYRVALAQEPKNFNALHFLGVVLMQQGRLQEAGEFASAAVKRNPASCDALMLLGSIALALNRPEEALRCFDRAVTAEPNNSNARYNRASVLAKIGRFPQALIDYDRVVAAQPRDAAAWLNRGTVLAQLGRTDEAIASFDRTLALTPDSLDALNNRAIALALLGRHGDALQSFNSLLSLQPNHIDALGNRAIALHALGRADEALADCDRALAVNADHINSLVGRGNVLHSMGRYHEALTSYDRALTLEPQNLDVIINRGLSLLELGRFEEALANAERAIAIGSEDARTCVARAKALQGLARYAEAIVDYQTAMKLNKNVADAAFNIRICHLRLGEFEKGWSQYEPLVRKYSQPRWDGNRVPGTLLLWSDEGIGDQIIYSSAIPDLKDRAGQIVVEVDPRLVQMFERSFPNVTVVGAQSASYPDPVDAQDVMSGLARHLRRHWEDFPVREQGFLKPDDERVRQLRKRFAADGRPIIGLSWVSKNPTFGRFKSARLTDFEALLRLPGYRFVDLQYGDTATERQEVERELGVKVERFDDIDNFNDLEGLAALISACDAVLTTSNTTAHLAGAVGARAWVMAPFGRGHLWYWFVDRPKSPWYPHLQVRYQLQGQPWPELIAALTWEIADAVSRARMMSADS